MDFLFILRQFRLKHLKRAGKLFCHYIFDHNFDRTTEPIKTFLQPELFRHFLQFRPIMTANIDAVVTEIFEKKNFHQSLNIELRIENVK